MNWLNFFVKLNYKLYKRPVKWKNRLLSPARSIMRRSANYFLPRYLKKKRSELSTIRQQTNNKQVIISLTSFPARIDNIWQTVVCLLLQTRPADRIILWLSEDQFGDGYELPATISSLIGDVFEVRWVKGDIRSHKKYYYVAQEYHDSLILLVDDDIYYPTNMLERIMDAYEGSPDAVICQYGYQMLYDEGGRLLPYNSWPNLFNASEDPNIFFGSGGGTLVRLPSLYDDLLRLDLATKLTPIADDVWLNAMARLAGLNVKMVKTGHILPVTNKHDVRLASENRRLNKNDEQIQNVSSYYLSAIGTDPFAKK